ncbi:universal stress protein [Natronobacterium gregoryi]|uniref:Universal stress protein n=2 Tax=Natronobacterium gregoryi TaxID=44930 RepID=L0AHM0_NATGS|nr:universal stress protein [Natronobacterium gregoryi]AFZ72944.1 universal stress protein UspA-like protein [Natronobacterium gregoryi SP2]ELY69908.1 UspA domain-containing protein [Natronobacterium gregoryi SP2]PLK21831.1 universal stress protein [Natronobacterium gregoryi SP2]SFI68207.1 Nucleotide-binding universal stress protein, UspA family [Natronobacterium gregoryi]
MVDDVLVPMDDSEMSERTLEYALEVFPDADVTVLHVVGEPSPMWGRATGLALADDLEEAADEHAKEVFERAREIAAEADGDVVLDTDVELGHPVRAIVRRAADYETVVIGSHGGSVADRIFVGNVAEKVFRRSPVPVVVVR